MSPHCRRGLAPLAPLLALLLAISFWSASADGSPARNADGSCAIHPGSHWDFDVSGLPVHPASSGIIASINDDNQERGMHPDFAGHWGSGASTIYYGIPYVVVDSDPAKGQVFPPGPTSFSVYGSESDKLAGVPSGSGRYPFPANAPVEGSYPGCTSQSCYSTDRHVLALDNYTCTLYEAWKCTPPADAASPWDCANGAAFNLSNPLLPQRPLGWTSADAAGLGILPGLVKPEEVAAGLIKHAIRFTARYIKAAYQYPASHLVTNQGSNPNQPWMGLRARLRADFPCTANLTSAAARTICKALQTYGVILADVGSPWYLTGAATPAWESMMTASELGTFGADMARIQGKFMEVVVMPGQCVCPTADCKDSFGNRLCPLPFLPSNPPPTPSPTPNNGGGSQGSGGAVRDADGSCKLFPGSHFDLDVSTLPKHPYSDSIVLYISGGNANLGMHPDFADHTGSGATTIYAGIPFVTVDSSSPSQSFPPGPTDFYMYPDESDKTAGVPSGSGRYPFPANAPVEGAYPGCSMTDCDTDRHVLALDNATCTLYEGWRCLAPASPTAPWSCANGAAFNVSNPLLPQRPLGWTSADAAGLPIMPLLVKVSEVKAGVIKHPIRFTARQIRAAYEFPASHLITGQGGVGPNQAWMGLRARLRANFSCSTLATPEAQVVCVALKKYGIILADAGRPWFLTGESSPEWEVLLGSRLSAFRSDIDSIKGVDMEVVMPSDYCRCTIAACLNELGTPTCAAPEVPGTPHAPPPTGTHLVVQTGLPVKRFADGTSFTYNLTHDAAISTMYQDTWNYQQGSTFFWPVTQTITVSDAWSTGLKFRVVMRFGGLEQLLPAGAAVQQALLNLTFINWQVDTPTLQVCALAKRFVATPPPSQLAYKGLGWLNTGRFDSGGAPIPWTQPGAAADCGATWTVPVPPGHEQSGMMRVTIALPASVIDSWAANNGSGNNGLLLWASTGSINLRMSQFVSDTVPTSVRPLLDIVFQPGSSGWSGYPATNASTSPAPAGPDLGNTDPQPPALRKPDGSCAIFPGGPLQLDVSSLPLHPSSSAIVTDINDGLPTRSLHPDFATVTDTGSGLINDGVPITLVDSNPAKHQSFAPGPTSFYQYPSESDLTAGIPVGSGRYPIPPGAVIEGATPGCSLEDCNTDRHVLVLDNYTCTLYEAWRCVAPADASSPWSCANGAAFNVSNPMLPQRPLGWTSADAAGLPMLAGLIKVDEVKAGLIDHAIRMTARHVQPAYAFPATHLVSGHGSGPDVAWMGMRARLRASYSCGSLATAAAKTICVALKKYGAIMSDVGTGWFLTGEASSRWSEAISNATAFAADMATLKGSDMEVVVPPGHCLCTIAECLNVVGTPMCQLPNPPGYVPPPPPAGTRVLIQTGASLTKLDGTVTSSYNGTIDAGFNTQYLASYNNYQGMLYPWPTTVDRTITELASDGQFRVLLRFDSLHDYIPATANINFARVNLTFLNYSPSAQQLSVCAVTKPWVGTAPAVNYAGLGWKLTGAKDGNGGAIAWTQPGAWADCAPGLSWNVSVPIGHSQSGMMQVSLQLPGSLITSWLQSSGAANFGLLLRCNTGPISLRPSQQPTYPTTRPALELWWSAGNNNPYLPSPSPAAVVSPSPVAAPSPSPQLVPSPSPNVVQSPSPALAAAPSPSPASGGGGGGGGTTTHILLQTGLNVLKLDGTTPVYNNTQDAGISTQYIDTWNYMQGTTYYWPSTTQYSLTENYAGAAFRPLMMFRKLHEYVPATATIVSASVSVSIVNWEGVTRTVKVCALKTRWVATEPPSRFTALGWARTGLFNSSGLPILWQAPGAWSDCDSAFPLSPVSVPSPSNGLARVTVQLPPALVTAWLQNSGAVNNGIMFRCDTGSLSIRFSHYSTASNRPTLDITYA